MVKGRVQAIYIEHYLKAQSKAETYHQGKTIRRLGDYVKKSILGRSICNNNQCFKTIPAKIEQYRISFFVRTTYDWNLLSDNIVNCDTMKTFTTFIANKDRFPRLSSRCIKAKIGQFNYKDIHKLI